MKVRHSGQGLSDKVEIPMTPMIDIVFQLLTFFLFSFKIATQEGDFNIRMPIAGPASSTSLQTDLPIKVRLSADADGNLASIRMDDAVLPNFTALHEKVMSRVGTNAGPDAAENIEAELDCDYNLKYRNVIGAVTAISGYVTPDGHIVKLIQKIKLSPPKKPSA
jgi:biopolymer transport protein ExbD